MSIADMQKELNRKKKALAWISEQQQKHPQPRWKVETPLQKEIKQGEKSRKKKKKSVPVPVLKCQTCGIEFKDFSEILHADPNWNPSTRGGKIVIDMSNEQTMPTTHCPNCNANIYISEDQLRIRGRSTTEEEELETEEE